MVAPIEGAASRIKEIRMSELKEIRMSEPDETSDPVWETILAEAHAVIDHETVLRPLVQSLVTGQPSLEHMLAHHLASKLGNEEVTTEQLREVFFAAFDDLASLGSLARADVTAVVERDPACQGHLDTVLYYKGFLGLQSHRIGHYLLNQNRRALALYLQNRTSEVFQVDIHPAAQIGRGVFIDHATGVVIGETARVGNNVSMLHSVTLGGNGKEKDDRHPKIGDGVLISVGAKILGNIQIGECSKIGAGSVVLSDIPPFSTAVGVPAQVVGKVSSTEPWRVMDHLLDEKK